MTDDEIEKMLRKQWGKGYSVAIKEILHKKLFRITLVFYKVTCERDGFTEFRCKGWTTGNVPGGFDHVTRRKW